MPHNAICAEIQVTTDEDSNSVLISENKARLLLGQLFSPVVSHVWRTAVDLKCVLKTDEEIFLVTITTSSIS